MKLFPASVSAIIFNSEGKILLVSPDGVGHWQTVTGWVEEESLGSAVLREIGEELSITAVSVEEIVDAHVFTHQGMDIISVFFLVRYISGNILPADDIAYYSWRWVSEAEASAMEITCPAQPSLLRKAFTMIQAL